MTNHPVLRRGVEPSDAVRELQDKLREHGVDVGTTNGRFGARTEAAVNAFQQANDLKTCGIVGPETWAALDGRVARAINGNEAEHSGAEHPDPAGQIEAWGYEDGVRGFQQSFAWEDIAVDGDTGPETARAVQKVVDAGGLLSAHFHMDEFRSHGNGRLRIHRETIRSCERTREAIGGPLVVLSGYRDPEHNAAIGGAPGSQHVKGTAVDPSPYLDRSLVDGAGWAGIGISQVANPGKVAHMDRRDVLGGPAAEFDNN
jgi:hypothetical protein